MVGIVILNVSIMFVMMIIDMSGVGMILVIFGIINIMMMLSVISGYISYGILISCGNCELNMKIVSVFMNLIMMLWGMNCISFVMLSILRIIWKMLVRIMVVMK